MKSDTPITVWWGSPCKSAIPMFRSMSETLGRDVSFIALNDLPAHRLQLGWEVPDSGSMPLKVLDESWQASVDQIVSEREGIHIVNGIYHDKRVKYCARHLARKERCFGVIMEAPANLEAGLKRLVKSLLSPVITPLRTKGIARRASFVLSASGTRQSAFETLGFQKEQVYPFGYFPDFPYLERAHADPEKLRILCVGYLEPFKGQDTLLEAMAILRARGVDFSCSITGYGSTEAALLQRRNELGLEEKVKFVGVVESDVLTELFRSSNVMVAPGFEEPWGIRVNEAVLSGLPVVVSNGVGAKELIENAGAGEIFMAGNARSLADSIQIVADRLMRNDLQEAVESLRKRITPAVAAKYIDDVIYHVSHQRLSKSGQGRQGYPVPPWLQQVSDDDETMGLGS